MHALFLCSALHLISWSGDFKSEHEPAGMFVIASAVDNGALFTHPRSEIMRRAGRIPAKESNNCSYPSGGIYFMNFLCMSN